MPPDGDASVAAAEGMVVLAGIYQVLQQRTSAFLLHMNLMIF